MEDRVNCEADPEKDVVDNTSFSGGSINNLLPSLPVEHGQYHAFQYIEVPPEPFPSLYPAWPSGHRTASESAREPSGDQTAVSERYSYHPDRPRISAIVQPIFTDVKGAIFSKYGYVFGCNEKPTSDSCGKIRAKVVCSSEETHRPYYKHERCNDPGCPICYPKFALRISDAVTERVMGYRSVYGFDPVYHLIFWPEYRDGYANLKEAFRDAKRMISRMGVKMAVVWYHPYRIRDEIKEQLRGYKRRAGLGSSTGFWQMAHDDVLGLGCLDAYIVPGPHFHAAASGYLMNITEYAKLNQGGYKKVRVLDSEEEIHRVAHYISTHACREATKSTVRYYGKISYSKLARDEGTATIEDVVCEICGHPLKEYHYSDDLQEITGLAHDHLTRKVMHYKYWKRGDKPAGMKKSRQRMIWGDSPP